MIRLFYWSISKRNITSQEHKSINITLSTTADRMAKRLHTQKNTPKIIRQVTKFSGDRLHVEIPSKDRKHFKPGDYVELTNISQ